MERGEEEANDPAKHPKQRSHLPSLPGYLAGYLPGVLKRGKSSQSSLDFSTLCKAAQHCQRGPSSGSGAASTAHGPCGSTSEVGRRGDSALAPPQVPLVGDRGTSPACSKRPGDRECKEGAQWGPAEPRFYLSAIQHPSRQTPQEPGARQIWAVKGAKKGTGWPSCVTPADKVPGRKLWAAPIGRDPVCPAASAERAEMRLGVQGTPARPSPVGKAPASVAVLFCKRITGQEPGQGAGM